MLTAGSTSRPCHTVQVATTFNLQTGINTVGAESYLQACQSLLTLTHSPLAQQPCLQRNTYVCI